MKGDYYSLALSTTDNEATGERVPLFAFPVQVCTAVDSTRDERWDVAAPSGGERKQVYLDVSLKDEVVDKLASAKTAEQVEAILGEYIVEDALCPRGRRVGDVFHEVSVEDRKAIEEQLATSLIPAEGWMDRDEFMRDLAPWAKSQHYLQSPIKGGSAAAYKIVYEALREVRKGKRVVQQPLVIVAKRVARTREQLVAIYADEANACLRMMVLPFVPAMREPDEHVTSPIANARVEQAQVDMARQVIEALPHAGEWVATADDDALALRRDLIERAVSGEGVNAPVATAQTVSTSGLMEALQASLEAATARA
jgi:hypothetical protein